MSTGYRDADTLHRLYIEEGLTQEEISDRYNVSNTTISNWMEKHGIDTGQSKRLEEKIEADKTPEEVIETLYWDAGLSQAEIADYLDTTRSVVQNRMDRGNIPKRDKDAGGVGTVDGPVTLRHEKRGYLTATNHGDEVRIHRLVAVAHEGVDALRGMVIHHDNGVPYDNRWENLEIMPQSDHIREHLDIPSGADTDQ